MEPIDIDLSIDVPNTPAVLTATHEAARAEDVNRSTSLYTRLHDISNDGSRYPAFIDRRNRWRAPRPSEHFGNSNLSTASSSSRNAHILRKGITEKNPLYPSHDSVLSNYQDNFVDLTERNMRRPGLANGTSSLLCRTSFRTAREEMDSVSGLGPGNDFRVGNNNIQERTGNGITLSHDPVASPTVSKRKRLVRNGCISPNNVSKVKQLAGKDSVNSVAFVHTNANTTNNNNGSNAYSAPRKSIDIRELVAEPNDSSYLRKGKGVITHPCSSKEFDSKNENRRSINFNETDIGPSDYNNNGCKSIANLGGWRSTRNRNREINISSPDENLHVIKGNSLLRYSSQPHESRRGRREKEASVSDTDDINPKSIEHVYPPSLEESVPHQRTRLGRLNGTRSTSSTLIKRQKQGSTSSTGGQCSTSVSDVQEVVPLNSPAETAHSRSTSRIVDNLHQTIGAGEFYLQLRRNARDEEIRARQLEADELLARELQEQFYNETPVFEVGEVDENIALALQHHNDPDNVLNERVPVSSLHRQSQTRASSRAPRRRSGARSTTSGRMTRQRSRFPGQARTLLSSRGRTSLFPEDMDVDTRMQILGALEEFHDMELSAGILQAPLGFNENDYEMLLALDDNNDRHCGASARLINGLPQSTVQSDNFDETCAVCLDTPSIGDIIRHLPCLHKFHKDCIDPWLRRRTSCPICKSSVS